MPSSSSSALKGISFTQIRKFIPRRWRRSASNSNESMVSTILTTLKDFASQGHLSKAFRTFSDIRCHALASPSVDLTVQSLSSLLLCSTDMRSLPEGKQLHAHIISSGLEDHPLLAPKLIAFYSAFTLLADAHVITETSNILHPKPWNILVSSYVKNGCNEEAIIAFQHMVNKGIKPDKFTYPCVFKACGEQLNLELGKTIHKSLEGSFVEHDLFVQNALVSMYGKCGETDLARKIFDLILNKDLVTWNSMISGYALKGMWTEAFELFESMQREGVELNIITWNTISGGCLRTGNFRGALKLLSEMRDKSDLHLDPVAVIIGLCASSHMGVLKSGKEIHGLAVRSYYDCFDNVRNALITMYARCKDLSHAHTLFELVQDKSIITWNSIISGYTHWDKSEEASFLFREMLLSGIEPNYVTIASILPLCARVADLQHGKEFHCYITRHKGFEDHLLLWNSLVDTYARSGKIVLAKRLFHLLKKKDVVTYTSLIAGYGLQGSGKEAIRLLEEMTSCNIKPDDVTMVAILSACSHSGLVVQGQMLFEKMQCVYNIAPRIEHFACMADLFGRAGLLKKAKEVITMMPFTPTPAMWATLIGACRNHGNAEIGEWAAEKLLEMRPQNPGYYVLIANMYAAAGCWSKLAKVRTFMRDMGVRKEAGCAWVNVGAEFSPFLAEDTGNSQSDEIHVLLGRLIKQMKDAGYITSEDSATEEELFCARAC